MKTVSLLSNESDKSTPQEERRGGGGINGVYDFIFRKQAVTHNAWTFGYVVKMILFLM